MSVEEENDKSTNILCLLSAYKLLRKAFEHLSDEEGYQTCSFGILKHLKDPINLSIDILEKTSWNSCIVLSKASFIQINFWEENLGRVNVKSFTSDFSCQSVVYSDASNTGYGVYIVETPFNIAHDKRIKWFSDHGDNHNVVSIVAKGSMKPELQDIALCIFENCLTHNISIDADWVHRTFNEKADYISRIIDYDDWGVGEQLFTYLDSLWGPHETALDGPHKITSEISPTDSDLVKNILEGAKRRLSVPVKKEEPITPDMLSQMFDKFYCENNLYNQRTICACLLSYSGFLRVCVRIVES
ncbi:unnamed protein product [Mytilus coruscus]|uniref:Uncharacterized protein n=1 Tax=Mytilus coruscus TaxID=42192 RepID=A0A6J8C707_MYTCO|nr:unnamed protein product [Mytilus coruscus]